MMMKALVVFLLAIVSLSVPTQGIKAQYKLDFKINNLPDTIKTVFLLKYLGEKMYSADTSEIVNGKVTFSKNNYEGGMYAFYTGASYFEFIMSDKDKNVSIETSHNNFIKDMKIIKSEENKIFYEYINFISSKRPISEKLIKEREGLNPSTKDSIKISEINNQLKSLDTEVKTYQKDLVSKHKGKLVSKILNMSVEIEIPNEIPDSLKGIYLRDHFWDNIDLSDERLARTPIFGNKVDYYFKNLVYQIPDSIVKQASFIIDQVKDSTDMMKYLLNYVHVKYETSNIMGMDGVYVGMSLKYYCPPNKNKAWWYPEQNLADRCEKAMTWEPLLLGKVAPNLRLADTTEKKWINVHELPNKHKVLIFWDPDCGHCKKEIPKLLKVYHELLDKKQDVAFIGIGTELDNEKWRKMIKEKNIDFINLSDFPDANKNAAQYVYEMRVTDYPSLNFRKTYDLFSTPQIYLLDENNKIVAKRLDANNLARILERRLDITLDYKEEPKDDKKKDTDK